MFINIFKYILNLVLSVILIYSKKICSLAGVFLPNAIKSSKERCSGSRSLQAAFRGCILQSSILKNNPVKTSSQKFLILKYRLIISSVCPYKNQGI